MQYEGVQREISGHQGGTIICDKQATKRKWEKSIKRHFRHVNRRNRDLPEKCPNSKVHRLQGVPNIKKNLDKKTKEDIEVLVKEGW
jgi:hypothetical protein